MQSDWQRRMRAGLKRARTGLQDNLDDSWTVQHKTKDLQTVSQETNASNWQEAYRTQRCHWEVSVQETKAAWVLVVKLDQKSSTQEQTESEAKKIGSKKCTSCAFW